MKGSLRSRCLPVREAPCLQYLLVAVCFKMFKARLTYPKVEPNALAVHLCCVARLSKQWFLLGAPQGVHIGDASCRCHVWFGGAQMLSGSSATVGTAAKSLQNAIRSGKRGLMNDTTWTLRGARPSVCNCPSTLAEGGGGVVKLAEAWTVMTQAS